GLTAGTSYYYRLRAYNSGGTSGNSNTISVTTATASVSCPAQVTVDNLPPGSSSAQVSFTGTWTASSASNAFGVNASLVTPGSAADTYTWKTPLLSTTQACTYQVFLWWPVSTTRSTSVPYTVSGQTGGPATKNFNQQAGGGQWNLHGTYTFPAGAIGTVTVTGGANGRASADAVQFVLAGPAD